MDRPLNEQLRDFRFEQQLSLAAFVGGQPASEERIAVAKQLIQELALTHLHLRLTKEQRSQIQDRLTSLAFPADGVDRHPPIGEGAKSTIQDTQQELF